MNNISELQSNVTLENKVKIGVLSVLVALFFAPVIKELISTWSTRDDYSHGFFVIPIALYLVWAKREKVLLLPKKPLWIGLPILAGGAMTYLVSFITNFHTLAYLSMVVVLLGLLLFLAGWQITKELLLPVLFLLFMFPIPTAYYVLITNPLKLMITKISMQIIHLMGVPVYREGNLLFLSTTQLEVAEACSGIRSLYSYLMLGCLFAFMSKKRASKIVLVVSTFPLALLVNIIRVTGTGILANYFGSEVAQGFFHEFTGFVLFIFGFVVLLLEYRFLDSKSVTPVRWYPPTGQAEPAEPQSSNKIHEIL